jgi:hypothetical protein
MNKEESIEFDELEKENERIRKEIKMFISDCGVIPRDIEHIFIKINELIENEIEQEEYCGQ